MKMIKIVLRNGSEKIVDEFKLSKILSPDCSQLVEIDNFDGTRSFSGFNKADIVEFFVDETETRKMKRALKGAKNLEGKEIPQDCPKDTLLAIDIYNYYKQQTKSLTI